MTGADLISAVRLLMRATSQGRATANTFISDDDIIASLKTARESVVGALLSMRDSLFDKDDGKSRWLAEGLVRISTNRLLKFTSGIVSGLTPVPSDFWRLECGLSAAGRYVPPEDILVGEGFGSQPVDQIFVKGGFFNGTALSAYYWASPSDPIANNATPFTEFSDGFYNVVKILAVRNLLQKERDDNIYRWKFLHELFLRRIATLR